MPGGYGYPNGVGGSDLAGAGTRFPPFASSTGGCTGAAGAGAAAYLLRAAIPKHCFERSFVTSTYYMIKNVHTCAALFYAATFITCTGAAAYLLCPCTGSSREATSRLYRIAFMLVVSWMPGYLFFNATGPTKYWGKLRSHFNPNSAIYADRERWMIVLSDNFLEVMLFVLLLHTFSLYTMVKLYVVPYLIVNAYLVLITYLQLSFKPFGMLKQQL
ncbi:hypothetical protein PR003_g2749 [Phytophthora rubi]|uniref:Uncharacterized protein n=1 Tax=Phytophthora rubi TaxID=129364 RepID=A0A6A3P100_9STRA|nr:hypothetical protein PR001_g2214 [Phytophthora rubi]KAE9355632.1 hypothetical protein PR003_g2749 [Phytophthora rubi]